MNTAILSRSAWRILALSLFLTAAPLARAADPQDPPTRAGRVVTVIGDAWLFDHETREWVRLVRNQTVGEGDRVRTDERARVSLRVGSTSVWVDERSDLELSQLDEGQTLLNVDRGDIALRLRSQEMAQETRVRTREGTVSPETTGLYRVEQLDRGTKAYNWQGRLRFDWQQAQAAAPVWLAENEQAEFWWPGGPRTERSRLYGDAFGDWVWAESRSEGDYNTPRYVSAEMTGAEDLDRHGRWETAADYGPVWIPTVISPGWAPYRHGHWVWTRHWGWSWVDDAPWGFAPFHYGRWVHWRDRWCWAPGSYVARPVYAPALVGWIGVAPGVSVGVNISIGSRPPPPRYGWYPLAPREVFVPGYHRSPRYEHRINDRPDWRNARDPITVQRPHQYRDTPTAISYLPQQGGGIQPLPIKPDAGWRGAQPIATAPSRNDFGPSLPVRTQPARTDEPRVSLPAQGWRSDGMRNRREPTVELPLAQPAPNNPMPPIQAPVQPQVQQPQPQNGAWRGDAGLPVRRDRGERGERFERNEPPPQPVQQPPQAVTLPPATVPTQQGEGWHRDHQWRQPPQAAPQPAPQAQPAAPQYQAREPEMPRRVQTPERQMRAPEPPPQMQQQPQRQVEVPRLPTPQPQPQAQPQRPQRDEGPQRRHSSERRDNER